MKLYVVHGKYVVGFVRHIETLFGVYTKRDAAEATRDRVVKQLYEKEAGTEFTIVKNTSDIKVDILEVNADELVNIELGGYWE